MGVTDFGTQTISFKYNEPGRSEVFNKLNYKILKTGIYEGGLLSYVDATTVQLSPFVSFIEDTTVEVGIRLETEDVVNLTVSSSVPFIVIRFDWTNVTNNFADVLAVAVGDIEVDDLVVGECTYDANVLQTNFDYSKRVDTSTSYNSYEDITNQLVSRSTQDLTNLGGLKDEVFQGLTLQPDTGLQCKLGAGDAISFLGTYLTNNVWGFTLSAGDSFSVSIPEETAITFNSADPTNPRIDILVIRPIVTLTSDIREVSYETQVITGTAAVSPSAPSKTAGWIKLAEVYVEANATTIHDFDIITYVGTGLWEANAGTIVGPELTSDVQIIMTYEYDTSDKWQRMLYTVPLNLRGHTVEIYVNNIVTLPAGSLDFPPWTNGNVVFKGINSAELHATALSTGLNITMQFDSVDVQFNSIEFYDVCFSVQDVNAPGGSSSFNAITCLFDWPDATGLSGYGFTLQGFSAVDWYNCDFEHGSELTANIACRMYYCSVVNSLPVTTACTLSWVYQFLYVTIMDTTNLNSGDLYESSSDYYTLLDQIDYDVSTNNTAVIALNDGRAAALGELLAYRRTAADFAGGTSSEGLVGLVYADLAWQEVFSNDHYYPGFYVVTQESGTFRLKVAVGGYSTRTIKTDTVAAYQYHDVVCLDSGAEILLVGEGTTNNVTVWKSTNYGETFGTAVNPASMDPILGAATIGRIPGSIVMSYSNNLSEQALYISDDDDGLTWTKISDDTIGQYAILDGEIYRAVNSTVTTVDIEKYNGATWDDIGTVTFTSGYGYGGILKANSTISVLIRDAGGLALSQTRVYDYTAPSTWTLRAGLPINHDISIEGLHSSINNVVFYNLNVFHKLTTTEANDNVIRPATGFPIKGKGRSLAVPYEDNAGIDTYALLYLPDLLRGIF